MGDRSTRPIDRSGPQRNATASPVPPARFSLQHVAAPPNSEPLFSPVQNRPASGPVFVQLPSSSSSRIFGKGSELGSTPRPPNNGTSESALLQKPYTGGQGVDAEVYEACTFLHPYKEYSLEELRLADYNQGRRFKSVLPSPPPPYRFGGAPCDTARAASGRNTLSANALLTRSNLQWLQGDVLEVHVGPASDCANACCNISARIWHLPKALLSQQSDFLLDVMGACTGSKHMPEVQEGRLLLPQEHQGAFILFVEWLYYGSYTLPSTTPASAIMDIMAYRLSEKLRSTSFQNYIMGRIYERYEDDAVFGPCPVLPTHVDQVFRSNPERSLLRKFFLDYLGANFSKSNLVKGSVADWDRVLQDHSSIRMRILEGMRAENRPAVKLLAEYLSKPSATT